MELETKIIINGQEITYDIDLKKAIKAGYEPMINEEFDYDIKEKLVETAKQFEPFDFQCMLNLIEECIKNYVKY